MKFKCKNRFIMKGKRKMDIDINLNEISHDDLLLLYNRVKDFISFLDNEIETSEVEKKTK